MQFILVSKSDSDDRVEAMVSTIADLEVTQIALNDNTIERHIHVDVLLCI